jgi:hypothetical protein
LKSIQGLKSKGLPRVPAAVSSEVAAQFVPLLQAIDISMPSNSS